LDPSGSASSSSSLRSRAKMDYFYFEEEPGRRTAASLLTKDDRPGRGLPCLASLEALAEVTPRVYRASQP